MNILLVSPLPPPYGGIANWSAMMMNHVYKTNDNFLSLNIAPKKRATEGRNLLDRVFGGGWNMLIINHKLKEIINHNSVDVIHMTTSGSLACIRDFLLIRTARQRKIPIVYHIRFGKTAEMAKKNSLLWKVFSKNIANSDAVLAIDKSTYQCIAEKIVTANVFLVPNPIDLSTLPRENNEVENIVLFLGWVVPTKGVTELIQAWNSIYKEFPEYKLVIGGQYNADYYHTLNIVNRANSVELLGELSHDEAMHLMKRARIFVLPSYTEGFPNVILEAMALNTAIVATDVGAIPEMLDDDCGIVIPAKSVEELAKALKRVLTDKEFADKMSACALEKVNERYNIDAVYSMYKKIWCSIKEDEYEHNAL